jgi:predicted RNA binding protein YcfA (HicA-like mRNA interferase family)
MATKKIKINFKMPTPTAAERLHALQQKNRKAAGLPDPSEYKKKLDSMKSEEVEQLDEYESKGGVYKHTAKYVPTDRNEVTYREPHTAGRKLNRTRTSDADRSLGVKWGRGELVKAQSKKTLMNVHKNLPEEVEQLDEISPQLKASYVAGAKKQIKQSLPFTKKTDEYRDIAKNFIAKRQKGIAKANEEVELLDEMPESSMKTRDVHSHLKKSGWELARSKGGHDVYKHPKAKHSIPVPRHNQLKAPLIRGIMKASKVQEGVTIGGLVGRGNIYQYDRNPGPRDGSELEHVPFHAKTEKQKKLQKALTDLGNKMKQTHPKLREAKDSQEYDYEGDMAKSDLRSIMHNAKELHDMIEDTTNLAEWCQSKITLAEDYLTTVTNYMRSEMNEEVKKNEYHIAGKHKFPTKDEHAVTVKHTESGREHVHSGKGKYLSKLIKTRYNINHYFEEVEHNDVEQLDEVNVGDKVSFDHPMTAVPGKTMKKIGTVHKIEGDTAHVKVKSKYGVMTHKKNSSELKKEEVELDEVVIISTKKPIGTRVADIGPGGKEYNVKTDKAWDDSKKKQPQGADFAAQRRKERLAKSGRMDEEQHSVLYKMKKDDKKIAVAHYTSKDDAHKFLSSVKTKGGNGIVRSKTNEEVELDEDYISTAANYLRGELTEAAKWRSTSVAKKVTDPDDESSRSYDYHHENPRSTGMKQATSDKPYSSGSLMTRPKAQVASQGARKGMITKQHAASLKDRIKSAMRKEEVELTEGRPSQRHPLEGHEYHKKTNAELEYIAKDAHKAAEAMKSHNPQAENKYRDQANDSATVRHFRKTSGMPDWYKKKYGHVNEDVGDPTEGEMKDRQQGYSRKAQIVMNAAGKSKKLDSSEKFQKDPELSSEIHKT